MVKGIIIVFSIYIFSILSGSSINKTSSSKTNPSYVPDRIVIKISDSGLPERMDLPSRKPGIKNIVQHPLQNILTKYKSRIKHLQKEVPNGYFVAQTVVGCDIEQLCLELKNEPHVVDASPDYYAFFASTIPDDTYFQYQYALYNNGQIFEPDSGISGLDGSDIKATDGWDWNVGGEDIIIAFLDSGVAINHEDLQGRSVPGYDFVNDDDDPYDDHGHGTLVASIAAANTNNNTGIAGVNWHARIMSIKVMAGSGYGSYLAIGTGMRYAVDNGAKIINLSIGGRNPSFILEDACEYCYSQGAVIVASAGNTGTAVLYPAAYDDYCLAVAATNADDERAQWSNYGPQIDIAAPGQYIWGAYFSPMEPENLNSYYWNDGTSYAAPFVSGTAAIVMSQKPFLNNSQVMDLIKYTADDINSATHPGVDDYIGYGRINLQTLLGPYELNNE